MFLSKLGFRARSLNVQRTGTQFVEDSTNGHSVRLTLNERFSENSTFQKPFEKEKNICFFRKNGSIRFRKCKHSIRDFQKFHFHRALTAPQFRSVEDNFVVSKQILADSHAKKSSAQGKKAEGG